MTIRILIADDQHLVRSGLRLILAAQVDFEVAAEAADGDQATRLVRELRPDVVLMDIRMPGTDGLSATRAIAGDPMLEATRVIILTTFDLDEYLFEALQAGAAGFLLKGASPEELVRGICQVASGDCLLAPSATRRLITEFLGTRTARPADRAVQRRVEALTPREAEVLALMARGFSNSEIAAELIVGENTVKSHVGHVLNKLDARDRVQAVIIAHQVGLHDPNIVR